MTPTSSRDYRAVKETIHRKLREKLDVGRITKLSREAVRIEVTDIVESLATYERTPITLQERERLSKEVLDEVFGLGPLEQLLKDNSISDILVNNYNEVYVERRGRLERSEVSFRDDAHLMAIITRIVSAVGRRVDETSPIVDARLADGSRANAIIPPLSLDGPCLCIRRFAKDLLTADDLIQNHTLTAPMLEFLRACVFARMNIIVSGGPGSGKTTLLNLLSSYISPRERIVTIEDATELRFQQDHVVRLETRPPNIEGSGAIPPRRLVINALRMRPDRIIVGEVRGDEALDMLQAMNTGHDGSLTTIHARAGYDAISRLETMVTMGGLEIPLPVIRAQIASAINLVIQVSRLTDGTRKIVNIAEITGMDGDDIVLQDIFVFNKTGIGEDEMVLGEFVPTGNRPKSLERLSAAGINLPVSLFDPREIQAFNLVLEHRGNSSDLAARKAVAEALASKAAALAPLDRVDEELETYDDIVERFGPAPELPLQEHVARALVGKGLVLDRVDRREEAVAAYDLAVKRLGNAAEPSLQEQIASALVSKGVALAHLIRLEEAIQSYDLVVKRFGAASEFPLQEQVARALVNKGVVLGRLNRRDEAIQCYDAVIKRLGDPNKLSLQEQLARALVSKGVALGRLNRGEEALQSYDAVSKRFSASNELSLREQVARALVSKGAVLTQLNRTEDAIHTYDHLLEIFTAAPEASIQAEVTRALQNKAAALTTLGRSEEEIESYNSIQERLRKVVVKHIDPRSWTR
ncbi:MAG TPA: ATPase, T2SS/T4P/T4SS family [Candidatus Acidoferrales bacterium]|nr:ATPase, T2SS/T4P/T4SS family [Candidatus Acidoferrum sp.]HUJ83408.1 ATPase, T2SS/T4P/T4SS family [Candidatus Acidoferrales bacterium]